MTWSYGYTPQIWPSFLTVLLMVALGVYSARRRSVPGALPFLIGCLFAAAWAAGNAMEVAAPDLAAMIFWVKFQAVWPLPLIIAVACFVLEYAWPGRWLTRRNLVLLSIPALVTLGLILTNDLHHLVWRGFAFDGKVIPLRGLGNWIVIAYGYGLTLGNLIILSWLFRRSPQHRWPVVIMVTGQILGRGLYLLQATQSLQSDLSLSVLAITVENLMYAIALFGFRIFDPISQARQTVIQQLRAGMFVLDPQGRIVSLNPAAEQILHTPSVRLKNRIIREVLPSYPPDELLSGEGAVEIEVSLGSGPDTSYYQLEISALKDWRGVAVGRLLLLHDFTEKKRAQAQLLEQQRALAILHERERLARELHDSLGQTLGYAGFQVEAASKLILDGRADSAVAQLNRLAGIVREAHADVREYILDLHSAPAPQQPFYASLRRYLKGFTNNYGIQALLSTEERLGDEPFSSDDRMQVYRILQEALSNARKHGQASCVQVSFTMADGLIRMIIQDNGGGFDPTRASGEGHFGLRFICERAEALGGRLQVESTPGQGTRVMLEVPAKSDAGTR